MSEEKRLLPRPVRGSETEQLRDYFAAQALQGLLANWQIVKEAAKQGEDVRKIHWFAETAYAYADDMIKQRDIK